MVEDERPETISQERYDAVKRKRDAAVATAEERGNALIDLQKRNVAVTALTGKVADPNGVADTVTQYLTDVKVEDVATHIASDEFKPRLAIFEKPATPPPPPGVEGEAATEGGTTETAAVEDAAGFGGPSPGGTTGTQALSTETKKIATDSPEYQEAIRTDNSEQIEKWDKAGQLETPTRPWT